MTYQTHAYFGRILYSCIRDVWHADISEKHLIIGSVKPDISSMFLSHPHFWNYSKKFIYKKIKKLASKRLVPGKKNKKFSTDLGIVLHYVSDFFTAVHNISPNKVLEHMAYEERLHKSFLEQVTLESLCRYANSVRLLSSQRTLDTCIADLRSRHAMYRPSKEHPENDIKEIVNTCFSVLLFIMDAVLGKQDVHKEAG